MAGPRFLIVSAHAAFMCSLQTPTEPIQRQCIGITYGTYGNFSLQNQKYRRSQAYSNIEPIGGVPRRYIGVCYTPVINSKEVTKLLCGSWIQRLFKLMALIV